MRFRPGREWIALACVPAAFVVATVAGSGLLALLGYGDNAEAVPLWAKLAVGGPMTALVIVPAAAAAMLGRRARQAGGGRAATVAMVLGGVAAAYLAVVFVLGLAGHT